MPLTCILDIESYDHRIIQVGKDLMKSLGQFSARAALKSELVAQICSGLLMLRPSQVLKIAIFLQSFWATCSSTSLSYWEFSFHCTQYECLLFQHTSIASHLFTTHISEEPGSISLLTAAQAPGGCC